MLTSQRRRAGQHPQQRQVRLVGQLHSVPRRRQGRAAELDHRRRLALGDGRQEAATNTRAWRSSSPSCRKPEIQMDWHTSTGYVPITQAAYELTRKSGYYDKNPGADMRGEAAHQQAADGELQGPALRQLRAGPRGDRGGDGGGVRGQEGRQDRARRRGASAATRSCASSRPRTSRGARRSTGTFEMEKRVVFRSAWLPYALVAPQIAITLVFFFWPAAQAVWYSFQLQDAFGLKTQFVGFAELRRAVHATATTSTRSRSRRCSACWWPVFGIAISLRARDHGRPGGARRARLQDAADLALRGGAGDRRRAVGVPVRALDRHRDLRAARARASTGTGSSTATRRCCWS